MLYCYQSLKQQENLTKFNAKPKMLKPPKLFSSLTPAQRQIRAVTFLEAETLLIEQYN